MRENTEGELTMVSATATQNECVKSAADAIIDLLEIALKQRREIDDRMPMIEAAFNEGFVSYKVEFSFCRNGLYRVGCEATGDTLHREIFNIELAANKGDLQ